MNSHIILITEINEIKKHDKSKFLIFLGILKVDFERNNSLN